MKADKKILVVDDETAIRKFLRLSLENEGYQVVEAATAADGIRELIASRAEVMILDLGLPDREGYEVIQKVREWSKVPILVLTVKDDDESKVKALDLGADDYITKPFSIPELLARLRVAERHATVPLSNSALFTSGPLEVDLAAHIVKVQGTEIHLTATEYDILKLLIKHAGKVVTHRQILQDVWGPNSVEHTQYLRVYMGQLRKKIESGPSSKKLLFTEPGVGYRLMLFVPDSPIAKT